MNNQYGKNLQPLTPETELLKEVEPAPPVIHPPVVQPVAASSPVPESNPVTPLPLIRRSNFLKFRVIVGGIISLVLLPFAVTGYISVAVGLFHIAHASQFFHYTGMMLLPLFLYAWMALGITWLYVILGVTIFARHKQTLVKLSNISFWVSVVLVVILGIVTLSPLLIVAVLANVVINKTINSAFIDLIPDDDLAIAR